MGSVATKHDEREWLHPPRRRDVLMWFHTDHGEVWGENGAKLVGVVALDRDAAATVGPVEGKRTHNQHTIMIQSSSSTRDVCASVGRLGEEMKNRSVMPHVEGTIWLPHGDVGRNPPDLTTSPAEPSDVGPQRCR